MKKKETFKYVMSIIVTAIVTCSITTIIVYNIAISPKNIETDNPVGGIVQSIGNLFDGNNVNNEISINEKMLDIKKKLEETYIWEIDDKKMEENALEGYVAGLGDEYTEYLTEQEVTSLMEEANGAYVGVGLYIAQNSQTNEILVIGVIENSPAHKAGILAGDVIKKVNNVEFTGEEVTKGSSTMKGVAGTKVKLTVKRDNKELEFEITRDVIKFVCITSEKLENNIGYIKISSFDGGCASDFEKAYKDLEKQNISSLIIDLRNNGGGLVDESLKIAELIVPKGSKMLITKDKNENEKVSTSSKNPIINMPIVILTNEYTASASEILTAAIRENIDTTVIGTKTFGKGIIQGIFLFKDQKTGMKITMQEYFTPKHNKLHKIGITPDVEVQLSDELKGLSSIEKEDDVQLKKAIEVLK